MTRLALAALVVATRAQAATAPAPITWTAELDVTETFDETSQTERGEIVTHELAHVTLVVDFVAPPERDGHLHLKTPRARVLHSAGRIDFTRDARTPTSESHVVARGEVQPEQVALALSADDTQHFALRFELGLVTTGTNTSCVNKACVDAPVPALPPLGWVVDPKAGATLERTGDAWIVRYERDAHGRHRAVRLVLRHATP